MKIKRRERDAVLQSLQAGLVPRQGLHLIQVGRKQETNALLKDIERVSEGGSFFRVIVGRFGSGKSFFINLVRTVALKQNLVVVQADFSMGRRLYAKGGEARALYSELVNNMAIRSKPDGGGLSSVCDKWVNEVRHRVLSNGGDEEQVTEKIKEDLSDMQCLVGGFEFAEVVSLYYKGWQEGDADLQAKAVRWLRAEYTTKTEARQDLGVRRIIDDENIYDSLKLMALFCKKAGFDGLIVAFDELVVLSHRLPSTRARTSNFESILTFLNDSIQGKASNIGFIFGGTDESLEDKRRGLYSYEALRSRLAENEHMRNGLVDLSSPVVRLQSLSPEDLYVLLRNISLVHASGDEASRLVNDQQITKVLEKANETLGAEFYKTPRDVIRSFIGLLNILDQNPNASFEQVLGINVSFEQAREEDALTEVEDDLADFKL